MRIWTIQPAEVWSSLQDKKVMYACAALGEMLAWLPPAWEHLSQPPTCPYEWIVQEMRERVSQHPIAKYPWWGWYRWNGVSRARPDLRAHAWWYPNGESNVRIELEIPDHHVLLSDYQDWHGVLGGWFHSYSKSEDDAFDRRLDSAGIDSHDVLREEPFRSEVLASWQRIFDLEGGDPEWLWPPDRREIQATFWELRFDQVQEVTHFKGRAVRR